MKMGGEIKGGNWLPAGWHRVITGDMAMDYIGDKKTPQFSQEVIEVDGERTGMFKWYVTEKAWQGLARWIQAAGVPDDVRETMDTDDSETMEPLLDRTLWILIDWVQSKRTKKWYREVVDWKPDGDKPAGGPKHETMPSSGRSTASEPAATPTGSEDDIPF